MNEELYKLNKELVDLVGDLFEQGFSHYKNWSDAQWYLMFAFIKSYRTINSVLILCERSNGQDAFVLVRTLFELMVNTQYVFQEDTDEKLRLFNEYDWVLRDRMLTNALNNEQTAKLLESRVKGINLEEIKNRAVNYLKTYKKGEKKYGSWTKKSIAELANETGLKDLYKSLYELGSQFVHSNSRAMNEYIKRTDSGEIIFQTYESDGYIKESLVGSFCCFLSVVNWVNKIFELTYEDKLNDLYERYKKLSEEPNPELTI